MNKINTKIFNSNNSFLINLNSKLIKKSKFFDIVLNPDHQNLQLNILDNTILEKPIYLINTKTNNLNIIINSGKNSKFTLIDHKNHQNNITNINCQPYSEIDYYLIQNNDDSKIQVQQAINSKFIAKILTVGLNNNKLKLEINLTEKNAMAYLNILQNTKQSAIHDINFIVNHLTVAGSSYTIARSIATDAATANLIGRVIVHKSAKKTYADLQSKGLLLSEQAIINSCPELDIYNNDLVCTHGASIGNLDQNTLFYMQTRGIDLENAKEMLLQAFIEPVIKKIKYPEIIDYLGIYTACI